MRCKKLKIVKKLNGIFKLDSTLHKSLEDQLLTVLLYGSEKFALNVNKEIIRLAISFLEASERFVQLLFDQQHLYIFFLYIYYFYLFIC